MAVWGIYCRIEHGQPEVVAVEASASSAGPQGHEIFRHRSIEQEDWPKKLWSLRSHLDGQLAIAKPEAVMVRSMDWPPVRPRENVVRPRLQVEGVVLEICRHHVEAVESQPGRGIGEICDTSKEEVEANAARIFGAGLKEAGAAAIAALRRCES